MLIPLSAKIEKCHADEPGRYAMHFVRFERKSSLGKPALVATNGRVLAIVPVEAEEHDADGWISDEALAQARKVASKSRSLTGARIVANGSLAIYDRASNAKPERHSIPGVTMACAVTGAGVHRIEGTGPMLPAEPDTTVPVATLQRPDMQGEFPRYSAVIPPADRREHRITFNPDFLRDLADALGLAKEAKAVTLGIACTAGGKVIREAPVRVLGGAHGAIGVLMPITLDGDQGRRTQAPDEQLREALDMLERAFADARDTLPHAKGDDETAERSRRALNVLKLLRARTDDLRAELFPSTPSAPPACEPEELARPSGYTPSAQEGSEGT